MKKQMRLIISGCLLFLLMGCATEKKEAEIVTEELSGMPSLMPTEAAIPTEIPAPTEIPLPTETPIPIEAPAESETLHFVDVFGAAYEVEIDPEVEQHTYRMDCFIHEGDVLTYVGDDRYTYRVGIDVSSFQGDVDWAAVKEAGIEFVIIRLGYRGYGQAGTLCLDKKFLQNIEGAQAQGLDVGVYFFAQAVNEEEALEEAEFVLKYLEGYELQLPVVYDPESILDDTARTDNVTGEQFTLNTLAFCERIEEAGYEAMVYSNMLWEAYKFDLSQLSDYPIWYADYEALPQTPYRFSFWQYTNTGRVAGITGDVDYNIQLIATE